MARNYSTLKDRIGAWLDDTELTAYLGDFIELAEDDINKDVRVRANTARALGLGAGTRFLPLPDGFVHMKRLRPSDTTKTPLEYRAPDALRYVQSGEPRYYTVHEELELDAAIDSNFELEMLYFKRFDALSTSNTTNWVLLNAWGLYLYGALVHAASFLDDTENEAKFQGKYDAALMKLSRAERKERYPSASMQSVQREVDIV